MREGDSPALRFIQIHVFTDLLIRSGAETAKRHPTGSKRPQKQFKLRGPFSDTILH